MMPSIHPGFGRYVEQIAHLRIVPMASSDSAALFFSMSAGPMTDPALRSAVASAIRRRPLASDVVGDEAAAMPALEDVAEAALVLARAGYSPDPAARQISASVLSTIYSEADLERAQSGLPLALVSNESCLEYEKAHLPSEAWPPTSWFEPWASGNNLFDLPGLGPCELRWLVYRKT